MFNVQLLSCELLQIHVELVRKKTYKMDERLFEDIEMAKYYQRYRPDYRRPDIEEKVIPFLREKLILTPDSLAVDVGCGTGQLTRLLASSFNKVIGVDVSQAQIAVAKEFTSEENIEYRISPAENLSFLSPNSVDLVSVAAALHYFDDELFFKEIDRILKPGGCLMVMFPSRPSCYLSMVPDSTNEEAISQCRSLMDEVSRITLQNTGTRASKICTTRQYPSPSYQEQYKFTTTIWKPLNGLGGFVGFLKSLGGLAKFRRDNPYVEDVIEVLQKRLEKILLEITSTPETFQLNLTGEFECNLYRKPCET